MSVLKIRPVIIDHEEICIHRLYRQKAAQPSASPPHHRSTVRHTRSQRRANHCISGCQLLILTSLERSHASRNLLRNSPDSAFAKGLATGGQQFLGKELDVWLPTTSKEASWLASICTASTQAFGRPVLHSRSFGIVVGKPIESKLGDSQLETKLIELRPGVRPYA